MELVPAAGREGFDSERNVSLLIPLFITGAAWNAAREMDVVIVGAGGAHGTQAPVTGGCVNAGQP